MAKRWYVINIYSGFEQKVVEQIKEEAAKKGLSENFEELLVPTEKVVEIKKGEKVEVDRKFYPGYILAKMEMSDEAWQLVMNTPKVSGFLGQKGKPSPISKKEVEKILDQKENGPQKAKSSLTFEIGEEIKVCDGPFSSFNGIVEDVDTEKSRLKVSVMIFGRATPVELDYNQVEKVV